MKISSTPHAQQPQLQQPQPPKQSQQAQQPQQIQPQAAPKLQSTQAPQLVSLDIFCNVIDNYGDAGVCLHLARTLSSLNYQVKLWCNNMAVLQKLTIPADHDNPHLLFASWEQSLSSYQPAQVVISAFSCHLDQVTYTALRQHPETLNINLEYLSAEDWVESCHMLPSPQDGYISYFFFPGFTAKTGGLNVDPKFTTACHHALFKQQQLLKQRPPLCFKPQDNRAHATSTPTTPAATNSAPPRVISLFGYDNPTILPLIQSLQKSSRPSLIKVFTGLALDNLNQLLQLHLQIGDHYQDQKIMIEVLPMLSHEEYDQILLDSDFNLVRGEDSIVRAIHTGHPFLWQIYPQDEDTHIVKLQSFLEQVKRINLDITEQAITTNTTPTTVAPTTATSPTPPPPTTTATAASDNSAVITPPYLPLNANEFKSAFAHFSQIMLAYNGSGTWPENFAFDHFEQDSTNLCYNLACYLNKQEPLAIRLAKFIAQQLQQPQPWP